MSGCKRRSGDPTALAAIKQTASQAAKLTFGLLLMGVAAVAFNGGAAVAQGGGQDRDINIESRIDRYVPHIEPGITIPPRIAPKPAVPDKPKEKPDRAGKPAARDKN